jgi:predicted AAA+ superfamily ATPase
VVYERPMNSVLQARLLEPRRTVQFLQGPRQVGKTTSVRQVLAALPLPSAYADADAPENQTRAWIREQWEAARVLHASSGGPVVLALDEVQKIAQWSDVVKQLWDEDTWHGRDVRVVVLGSQPWLAGRGMSESMAGRYEVVRATHWTWPEVRDAFGWDLERFVHFGGYPGAAAFVDDEERWRGYVLDTAIESTVTRDVLHMTRVDKPALLRQALYLGCEYSARELSLQKMRGRLEDAGSVTTLANYLHLLDEAGMLAALNKYAGQAARRRASVSKLQVRNNALVSAVTGRSFTEVRGDPERWGRVVESCVGAYLAERARETRSALHYWRAGNDEVDFVYVAGSRVLAVEVKTAPDPRPMRGLAAFKDAFGGGPELLVVGAGGMPLDEFLSGGAGI